MSIENGDKPVNPLRGADGTLFTFSDGYIESCGDDVAMGLSKREHFAAMAMQGLLVNAGRNGLNFANVADEAYKQADNLLKKFEEK